jgi:hypothetical protein
MGHVKVVKSSPYFSRFQTKVRAVCARAHQFPFGSAARSHVARISRKALLCRACCGCAWSYVCLHCRAAALHMVGLGVCAAYLLHILSRL